MKKIDSSQYRVLNDFYLHCFYVFHYSDKDDFSRWAKELDQLKVPWAIQNIVADIAQDLSSKSFYLSSLLKKRGIEIQPTC